MGLLDGGLAGVFASALSGIYLDATLHRANVEGDGKGGGSVTFDDEAVKVQLDRTTERTIDGNADTFQRILVLASGVDEIRVKDEITVKGIRWAIADVGTDPVMSYYDLAGRKSGRQAAS